MIFTAHPSPQSKRHPYRFSRLCTDDCRVWLYFTMGRPFSPKNLPFPWGIWTPSNTSFPGPTQVLNPNGSSIGSAVFARLTSVTGRPTDRETDRQNDRPHYSVGKNRPHLRTLRCGLKSHVMLTTPLLGWFVSCRLGPSTIICRFIVETYIPNLKSLTPPVMNI